MAVSPLVILYALSLVSSPASPQTLVAPGETASIVVEAEVPADDTLPSAALRAAQSAPSVFSVLTSSRLGPATASTGTVVYFQLPLRAYAAPVLGSYGVTMTLLSDEPRAEFDAGDISVDFNVAPRTRPGPDVTPPVTRRTIIGPSAALGPSLVLSTSSKIRLDAVDPTVEGAVSSGVFETRYLVDTPFIDTRTTPGAVYAQPFTLPLGPHSLTWFSLDRAGNREATAVSSVTVDGSPPSISSMTPAAGAVFGGSTSTIAVFWSPSDDNDPAPASSGRLVEVEDRGVPNTSSPTVIAVLPGDVLSADNLDDGLWVLQVSATDFVLNASSAASGPFEVIRPADTMPPRTRLTLGAPSVPGNPAFVGPSTLITLSAEDDRATVNDKVGVGVASITYSVDGATTVVPSSFTSFGLIQEGTHTLAYFAADKAGHIEAVRVASVTVDATPPALSFAFQGSSLTDRLGRVVISTDTRLVLSAADALSGVGSLRYSLDGGPEASLSASSTSLTFPDERAHSISFYALDRVQNRSITFSTTVIVDVSPPTFGPLSVLGADGGSWQDAGTALSTTSADASILVSDLGSGLAVTAGASGPVPLGVVPNTLGLWHFDEPSGSVARDDAGVAGDGTLNDGVSRIPTPLGGGVRVVLPSSVASTVNAGVTLPRSAFSVINNMPSGTIEARVRIPVAATSGYNYFTVKQHDGSNTMFWFVLRPTPSGRQQLWQPGNSLSNCSADITLDPAAWYLMAVSWDPSGERLYVNGQRSATCPAGSPVPNDTNPTCLSIAGACGDGVLSEQGVTDFDEVRVLSRALSDADLASDWGASAPSFSARLSGDGGQTFVAVSSAELPGSDGTTSPQYLTAHGLSLKASTSPTDSTNLLEVTARDLAGHVGTARRIVLVNLNKAVAPTPVSPADQAASSVSLVGFSWDPGPGVPAASIIGYEFQYARDSGFALGLVTLSSSTNSLAVTLPEGTFFWRVAGLDRFGQKSPYSPARRVFVDSQPPVFMGPEVSTAPGAAFRPAAAPVNAVLVDARASVRDFASGLRVTAVPGGPSPLSAIPGTLGLWHFDEAMGSVALNSGGPAGSGTLNANVTRRPGILGGAVDVGPFTGSSPNAGVTLGPGSFGVINNMPAGTIELWAKLLRNSTIGNMTHIFTVKQHDGSNTEFLFSIQAGVTNELWHPGSGPECNSLISIDPSHWYHFAATWDSSAAKLYVDGASVRTCSGSFPVPNDPSPTCISIAGGCGDAAPTDGERLIDEVRVLNFALPAAEISKDASNAPAAAAYSAALSTDGGLTFRPVDPSSVSLTGMDGTTSTETLTARGLALVESASAAGPLNVVRLSAADMTGRTTDFLFTVLADTTPPSVAVTSPAAGSVFLAPSGTLIPIVSASDRLDPAPGVFAELVKEGNPALRVAVSTGLPADLSGLATGQWRLSATATDFAGNVRSTTSGMFSILRDVLPPRTALVPGTPAVQKDVLFVTPRTPLAFSAVDDLAVLYDSAGTGVALTSYALDATAYSVLAASASVTIASEAVHVLRWFSADLAGNAEGVRIASVAVDATPPTTGLLVEAASRTVFGSPVLFVRGLGPLRLGATDYPAVAVGVAATYLSVDGGQAGPAAGPFSLSGGLRSLAFASVDALGNFESTVTVQVKLDVVPPAPVTNLAMTAPSTSAVGVSWTVPGDDGAAGDILDGEARLAFGLDPAALSSATALVIASGTLAAGASLTRVMAGLAMGTSYYAAVYTRDTAGNWSAQSPIASVKTLELDVKPPRTTLSAGFPSVVVGEELFVTPATFLVLASTDDFTAVGDRRGVGVAAISYSVDSSTSFVTAASTGASFALVGEGTHTVRYFGVDLANNVEAAQVSSVAVDGTPPQTALTIQAPFRVLAGTTTVFVRGLGPLSLGATDYPAIAVGVAATYLSVDGGPAVPAAGTLSIPGGLRSLAFASVDALGYFESTKTARVKLDAAPPAAVTDLSLAAASSTAFRVAWTAPGDDGAAGDVYDAAVRLDFGKDPAALDQHMVVSSGPLSAGARLELAFAGLAPNTTYYAVAFTRDTAGNWSAPSAMASARTVSVTVSRDGVASVAAPVPVAVTVVSTVNAAVPYAVAIGSQGLTPSGTVFYELTSGLQFPATAPAVISFTFDRNFVDTGSVSIYTYDAVANAWTSSPISSQAIALLDNGLYRISGEILHTSLYAPMVRDTAAPLTAFSLAGSSAVLEGRLFAAGGSSGALTAQDLAPRGGVASGVAGTLYKVGAGPESPYIGPFPLAEGALSIAFRSSDRNGNVEGLKEAQVFVDASAPLLTASVDQSSFAVPGGFGTLSATATLTLGLSDPEVGGARSGLAAVSVTVDGEPLAAAFAPGAGSVSTGVYLSAGLHSVSWSAADRLGHLSAKDLRVAVGDTQPPVTALSVGLPKAVLPDASILVSAASALSLSAVDSAESGAPSGPAATFRRFAPAPFSLYGGTFAAPAPDGAKTLEFYSTDRAGNAEAPKSAALVLDATPPAVAVAFPRPDEPGLCRLAQGPVSVRGSVSDAHLASWSLTAGGVLVGSGTANASGTLAVFDPGGLTGPAAFELNAQDLVLNASSASFALQGGRPARAFALGGRGLFNKPRGVAAGPNRIYVADTNADLVRVFDAGGAALAAYGDKKGALRLQKPQGVAVDGAGNIFVADTGNNRVLKLSPSGALLVQYDGRGVLNKPAAVTAALGRVLVADTKAGSLAVYADAGNLLGTVNLPPAVADDGDPEEPRPMALAADAAGGFWVADTAGRRVLRYTPGLSLAQTLTGFQRPDGLAVSPSGACLAVADSKADRLRTFDAALGAELAAFGVHGELKDGRPLPAELVLNKPAQLAFTPGGTLLVADRNNDAVQGFGLPGAPMVLAWGKAGPSGGGRLLGIGPAAAEPGVTARIGSLEGGTVTAPDRAAVEVQPGSLAADQDVTVAPAAQNGGAAQAREGARAALGLSAASLPHEFGPQGLAFSLPARVTLPYDPLLLAGAAPRELKVHYWNEARGAWEALDSRVDEDARTVSAEVRHFSLYQALAPARALSVLTDPEASFLLRDIYVFPNPAVGGHKPSFHIAVGRADKVTVRIYDIAGTPVHQAALDGAPAVIDDGSGPHYAYEYAWDGRIASGVYIYSVTAEKSGNAPIKRIGKFAVVR